MHAGRCEPEKYDPIAMTERVVNIAVVGCHKCANSQQYYKITTNYTGAGMNGPAW